MLFRAKDHRLISRSLVPILLAIVLVPVVGVGCLQRTSGDADVNETIPPPGYEQFLSDHREINFTFFHPTWWELIRIEDLEDLTAITFMGDLGNYDDLAVYIYIINNEKRKKNGIAVITPEKDLEAPLAYWKRQRNFRLLRDTTIDFGGVEALDVELTADVTMLPPPEECARGGCYRTTRDRFIAAGYLGRTYSIHIGAWADQYEEHTEEIERFLDSFRFIAD